MAFADHDECVTKVRPETDAACLRQNFDCDTVASAVVQSVTSNGGGKRSQFMDQRVPLFDWPEEGVRRTPSIP